MTRAPLITSRRLLAAGGVLLLLLVVLAVLALPFRGVKGDADRAQRELEVAAEALRAGDLREAGRHVRRARDHVDDVTDVTEGLSGTVWSWVPVAGSGVRDVRRLGSALDDATSVVEIGLRVHPEVAGEDAGLLRAGGGVDLSVLDTLTSRLDEIGGHLSAAHASLQDVEGDVPLVGDSLGTARDRALADIAPLHHAWTDLEPVLAELPEALGAEGRRRYLVAMLNPSELRYSGGAPLSFAPIVFDEGRMTQKDPVDAETGSKAFRQIKWSKVHGNPFHTKGRLTRIANANFAPSWSVSGPEMLRAWRELRGIKSHGLIAVDVVALAGLLEVTGPIEVPGQGRVTSANLVERLVGSYDDYGVVGMDARRAGNRALVATFVQQVFSGEDLFAKVRSLDRAAAGRHLAMFFHEDELQRALGEAGWSGDLGAAQHDYLGVFTQSTGATKSDYWQRRRVASEVHLSGDGSAEVELRVEIHNDSPPWDLPFPDPGTGYFTRWNPLQVGVFLPSGARPTEATLDGEEVDLSPGDYYGRPYVEAGMLLEPGAVGTLELTYAVPQAAVAEGDSLSYRLALDPQGIVGDQSFEATVHLPDGYRATDLPEGWTARGGTARFRTADLEQSWRWEVRADGE